MATDVTLMILPSFSGGEVGGLPQIFMEHKGLWCDLSSHEPYDAAQICKTVEQQLKKFMVDIAKTPGALVWPSLRTLCLKQLYEKLVPLRLREALQAAADSGIDDDLPVLRIHTSIDWIPWELMHDGTDFLGLRFLIARLPIGPTIPNLNGQQPHQVHTVYNLLAEHLFNSPHLFGQWEATFASLSKPPKQEVRFPTAGGPGYPTLRDLESAKMPDILHITCHGGEVDKDDGKVYWTLNHKHTFHYDYRIKADNVEMLGQTTRVFEETRPLVFGNACASVQSSSAAADGGGLVPGFGPTFFAQGATAFVGTFVPITEALSVQFACEFYQQLLQDELPIAKAMWATKKHFRDEGGNDPSYLFYCLYGLPETRFQMADG